MPGDLASGIKPKKLHRHPFTLKPVVLGYQRVASYGISDLSALADKPIMCLPVKDHPHLFLDPQRQNPPLTQEFYEENGYPWAVILAEQQARLVELAENEPPEHPRARAIYDAIWAASDEAWEPRGGSNPGSVVSSDWEDDEQAAGSRAMDAAEVGIESAEQENSGEERPEDEEQSGQSMDEGLADHTDAMGQGGAGGS
ncbi:MAG: hypothetical protein Q9183_004155 [Haloplaca sp. 2 TL-2023]